MNNRTKFQATPPPKPAVDPAQLAAFAGGADAKEVPAALPWAGLDDKRRTPAFPVRLTDMEKAILTRIDETTPHSRHEYCIRAIRKAMIADGLILPNIT